MELSSKKRNIVLSILFFLPVAFILVMLLSKDNYNPLDIVKEGVAELPDNKDNLQLKDHITILSFLGKKPMENSTAAFNLKELVYDRSKGFKTFQVVMLLPYEAKTEAEALLKEIRSYEDLRFWHLVYADDSDIKRVFNSLKSEEALDNDLSSSMVFIIDRDLNQRGRLDDRTEKEIEANKPLYSLYSYDCVEVAELKNKMAAEDMRVLFKEYRDKRKGDFDDSNQRRSKDLKQTNE
ncbi:hypothetical protein BWZ20_10630 [Winogradskyella sp. J14-2]|uniref:hypothetical protein n=1 Tax=Winogradskyella sp. J14-2 TaxID=1936080 RepID=UPI000972E7AD|nr:hypothetical protein [Winogradskyella sp. J14-2]APY08731.1 hypothetical protein BWZ20_10630 [Winogradskyella sp. J14-2]